MIVAAHSPLFRLRSRFQTRGFTLIKLLVVVATISILAAIPLSVGAETPEEWIALGRRVHGGFGSYIVIGIRIGLDARKRLDATPRELDVTYQDGANTPCACAVDGIMLATTATPGQGLLRVLSKKAGKDVFGIATIKNMQTGKAVRYTIPIAVRAFLDACNKKGERERYEAVMDAPPDTLFRVETMPALSKTAARQQARPVQGRTLAAR